MDKKPKKNISLRIIFLFLIIYISLCIALKSGYYKTKNNNNIIYTEEQVSKFEKDIKEGKQIDINSYLKKEVNYNNKVAKVSLDISNSIEKFVNRLFNNVYDVVKYLIE